MSAISPLALEFGLKRYQARHTISNNIVLSRYQFGLA